MENLKDILLQGYESKDLDYKNPFQWDEKDKKACCEIIKDLLALANTLGGYIVIGVKESKKGFEWEGLTTEQTNSFETTRINRFLQNYADPPINTLLKRIDHEGKTFVIIEVPRFSDTPHVCQKDYPGILTAPTIYVRTDNNESAPLKSSSDFRSIVEHSIRNRSERMLSSMRAILTGTSSQTGPTDTEKFDKQFEKALERFESFKTFPGKNYRGYREASFNPSQFMEYRFDLEELRAAVKRAQANFRGWPFLFWNENQSQVSYSIQDGLETFYGRSDLRGQDRLDFWRFHQTGFFYQRVLMWEESYANVQKMAAVMEVEELAMYSAEAIYCLGKIYEDLIQDDEEITLKIRVLGAEGRALFTLDQDWQPFWGYSICKVPEVVYRRSLPVADWKAGSVDLAVEVCKEIFIRFNWLEPELLAIRKKIEKMFSRRF